MRKTRNKFEERIRKQLIRSNVEFGYEDTKIPYVLEGTYLPDFNYWDGSGSHVYVECKGYFRAGDKRKLAAVRRCHPHLDIRLVFYERNDQYIRWANKHGFPYAIGAIPEEWLTCS